MQIGQSSCPLQIHRSHFSSFCNFTFSTLFCTFSLLLILPSVFILLSLLLSFEEMFVSSATQFVGLLPSSRKRILCQQGYSGWPKFCTDHIGDNNWRRMKCRHTPHVKVVGLCKLSESERKGLNIWERRLCGGRGKDRWPFDRCVENLPATD